MLEEFEEARSIRRKNKRGEKPRISEEEKRRSEIARLKLFIEETDTAIEYVYSEAEKYNTKLKEVKTEIKRTLFDSKLDLKVKSRKVAELRKQKENCEFVIRQSRSRWAKLTDKKKALERALAEIDVSK